MSTIDQNARTQIFETTVREFVSDRLATEAVVIGVDITNEILDAYRADLSTLVKASRVLDDVVSVAKIANTSTDIPESEMWRKIRNLLQQEGLLPA